VFTPKGDVINLPAGSTPIDFAYRVHTAVGNNCVGAKVDGRIVPLDYKLKNGNIVVILTSSNSNGPSRDWLKIVKSSQAKSRVRQWFKKEERDDNIVKGKDTLEKEVKRQGFKLTEILKDDWLKVITKKLSLNSTEDLYAAIGYGSITLSQVMIKLKDFYKEENIQKQDERELLTKQPKIKEEYKPTQGITITGIDNIKVRFSRCCNPVPGDEIAGYITRGRGVSVHRSDCPNVADLSLKGRFIDVEWDTDKKNSYQAEIQIKASDRTGLLTEITQLLTEVGLTVTSLNARTNKEKIAMINMTLEIRDIEQLKELMRKIKRLVGVMDVYRVIT